MSTEVPPPHRAPSPTPETETRLVHLLWYLGTATTIVALGFIADAVGGGRGQSLRVALILGVYSVAAVVAAFFVLIRLRGRNVLTGILIVAATLTFVSAWLIVQDYYNLLKYGPFPTSYHQCGKLGCERTPVYASLTYLERLEQSPLGAVSAATVVSIISIALFRFLPMTVILVLCLWYMAYDYFGPTDDKSFELCLLWCGTGSLFLGWFLDKRLANNYGFWVNKLATWGMAGGLLYFFKDTHSEVSRLLYLLLNVGGMLLALYLRRPAGVFGFACGAFAYVVTEYDKFRDYEAAFGIAVFAGGALLAYLGWKLQRAGRDLDILIPKFLEKLRPEERHEPIIFGTEALFEPLK